MGIIKTQSLQSTVFIYLGVFIGFCNTALLMPKLLSAEDIGLLTFLNALTNIMLTIFSFGVPLITIKLFPLFRQEGSTFHNGFFSFSFLMSIAGSVLGVLVFIILEDYIILEDNNARNYKPFFIGFLILLTFRVFSKNLDALIRMLYNTVLGAMAENLILKAAWMIALVIFWVMEGYDFIYLFLIYVFALSLPGVISLGYLIQQKHVNFGIKSFAKVAKGLHREMWSLGLFGMLTGAGAVIILEIDRIMVSNMLGLRENGIYTVAFFFGIFINIPSRAIRRVVSVVLSDAWLQNDIITIKKVYAKSCSNMFLLALYLFLGVWLNIDFVLDILPSEYAAGKYVIFFIAIAQIADMLTGVNTEVIATSRYYRVNTYFVLVLIVLVVALNYILIPVYGITGAAIASSISIILVNVLKYSFLYKKMNFQPLGKSVLLTIGIGIVSYMVIYNFSPKVSNPYLGIIIVGSGLSLLYWLQIYFFKVSEDVNGIVDNLISRLIP